MPARKRNRQPTFAAPTTPMTDVERFAAGLKVAEAKEQAAAEVRRVAREAETARRAEAKHQADEAARHEAEVKRARAAKGRAVERLKDARRAGRGVPEAEAAWRDATAALVELETGQRATWDRRPTAVPETETDPSDPESESATSVDGSDSDDDANDREGSTG